MLKTFSACSIFLKECGFKVYISRTTHLASEKVLIKMGGYSHKKIYFKDPERSQMDGQYMDFGVLQMDKFNLKSLEEIYGARDEDDEIF